MVPTIASMLIQKLYTTCSIYVFISCPHLRAMPHSEEWAVVAGCGPPLALKCSPRGARVGPFFAWSMMAYTVWCPAAATYVQG